MNQRSLRYAKLGLAAVFAASMLAGCGGGDDEDTSSTSVPASAGESSASFLRYLQGMVTNDTAEPLSLEGFIAPVNDTSEAALLT